VRGVVRVSTVVGVGNNPAIARHPGCFIMLGASWLAFVVGFAINPPCHDEHSIAKVRGADGRSGYAVPKRIVPERGQVSENGSETQRKVR
jgi:hypothetical protein